ncbi:hypothetical protein RHMOL_Rhmol01G0353900 [Rhododendron molle]|uniref:Uncharacterized protein n=1 Tax=Rhododendron molle TaxID=49168 RepID=A0ACC0QAQ8_RHOML|nr:hypothetical protein RHMOL_Rhmol01G0353900 [Rhododendron molle]
MFDIHENGTCDLDDTFDSRTGKGGVGFAIWGHGGNILGAEALPVAVSTSAEVAEALGFRSPSVGCGSK